MSRLTRTVSLFAISVVVALTIVRPAHGQRFAGYQGTLEPMLWEDFSRWMSPAHHSDGQVRFIISLYDDYYTDVLDISQRFRTESVTSATKSRNSDLTTRQVLNSRQSRKDKGERAMNAVSRLDRDLFSRCIAILSDEQIETAERAQRRRARSRFSETVDLCCSMNRVQFVDLVTLVSGESMTAEARTIVYQYEFRLGSLMKRLFEEVADRQVTMAREHFAQVGDVLWRSKVSRDAYAEISSGPGTLKARELAQDIGKLTQQTVLKLGAHMNPIDAFRLEYAYFSLMLNSQSSIHPRFDRLLHAYDIESDPAIREVLGDALRRLRSELRVQLDKLINYQPPDDPNSRLAGFEFAMKLRGAMTQRMTQVELDAQTALLEIADESKLNAFDEALIWRPETLARKQAERSTSYIARGLPSHEQITRPWLEQLSRWSDIGWTDDHESAYTMYLQQVSELDECFEPDPPDPWQEELFALDWNLIQRFTQSSDLRDSDDVDVLLGIRKRRLMLAGVGYLRGVNVDIVDLVIELEIDWRQNAELRDFIIAYGADRQAKLRAYLDTGEHRQQTAEMSALASRNYEFLESVRPRMGEEQFDALWSAYWTAVQPQVFIDPHAAIDRFKRILTAHDALQEDLRVALAVRWLTYEDRYRDLTDRMLELLRMSFSWGRILSGPTVNGYIPDLSYQGGPLLDYTGVVRLYHERANLSALEHAYLDTIRIPEADAAQSVIK